VLQDYLHTAEKLDKEAYSVVNGKALWIKGLKVVAILGLIGGPIVLPIIQLVDNRGMLDFRTLLDLFGAGFIAGPFWAVFVWAIFGVPFVWLWARDRREDLWWIRLFRVENGSK
jgi:hypothetical protein